MEVFQMIRSITRKIVFLGACFCVLSLSAAAQDVPSDYQEVLKTLISQMDVPTRESYTMAVVRPEERSAAGGITGVARTSGAAISPIFAGLLFSRPALIDVPFFIAGTLKIAYDLVVYHQFAAVQPPEEADSFFSRE
jgi:MFS family permease